MSSSPSPRPTGQGRHFLHARADLLLTIGCGLNRHQLTTPLLRAGMRVIHATNYPRDLHKSFATEMAWLGDTSLTIAHLIAVVRDRLGRHALDRAPEREVAERRRSWLGR